MVRDRSMATADDNFAHARVFSFLVYHWTTVPGFPRRFDPLDEDQSIAVECG